MSRFASKELQTIDLGEGEWVKIPVALSYAAVVSINNGNAEEIAKKMLFHCIKEWNIKNEKGEVPPITEETILDLDIPTITLLSEAIGKIVTNDQDKKK